MVDRAMLKDMQKNSFGRLKTQIRKIPREEYNCSQMRACKILCVNRVMAWHKDNSDKDAALRKRMGELAEQRKRFGAPRLHVLLKQEGLVVNHKRAERIYREENLSLRKSRKKKKIAIARKPAE